MKDIRIISGKGIAPDFDTTIRLLEYQKGNTDQSLIKQLFWELSQPLQMRIQPKAAILITKPFFDFSCENASFNHDFPLLLYVMLTIGKGADRLMTAYKDRQEPLKSSVIDAMADSCLFAFEKQLFPILCQICKEEGYGMKDPLEIPRDLSLNMQREIFQSLDADRTLGLSITSDNMLIPAKTMSLVFTLTNDLQESYPKCGCKAYASENPVPQKKDGVLLRIKHRTDRKSCFKTTEFLCPPDSNLLEILQKRRIFLPACCGGSGICGKCGVQILRGSLPVTKKDKSVFSEEELQKGMRLSCLASVKEPLTILLNSHPESDFKALGTENLLKFHVLHSYPKENYGIAIDIGTTTLAFSLLDLHTGACLDTLTMVNPQRAFGADVISRIQSSNSGQKDLLQKSIQSGLQKGISLLLGQHQSASRKLCHIVIAANTVMLHLLRGYSCKGLSGYPFWAKTLSLEELTWEEMFGESADFPFSPKITLLPGIAPFIGADITAGLYACHILSESKPVLFLDLGTNGEMALWKNHKLLVSSAAAGPAFEGGNIKWGMGSVPGAISGVTIENGRPIVRTIGNKQPAGICGTGALEITAELLRAGISDQTGRLKEPYFKKGYPLAQTDNASWIVFTNQDIREIQMAKAAIRAGMETLLARADTSYEEIDKVHLAGGFGYYLDIKKAAAISLLPKELLPKTIPAGNTSLKGALLYLAEQKKETLAKIIESAAELSLAKDEYFQELYIKYIDFISV